MKTYFFNTCDEGRAISWAKSPGKDKYIDCLLSIHSILKQQTENSNSLHSQTVLLSSYHDWSQ